MYFPKDVFTHIISYCDDSIERKQKKLWNSIKIKQKYYSPDDDTDLQEVINYYTRRHCPSDDVIYDVFRDLWLFDGGELIEAPERDVCLTISRPNNFVILVRQLM
jgi:hypothetical protein